MEFLIILLVPVVFAILIGIYGERSTTIRNTLVIVPAVIDLLLVAHLTFFIMSGGEYTVSFVNIGFFALEFRADYLSVYVALSMTFLWLLTNIYSFGYMADHGHALNRYFAFLTVNITAAMGIVFASNLITFFIFFEMLTICVYPLVIHEETKEAYEAGIGYGIYLFTGGAAVLLAIIVIYNLTGTIEFMNGGIPALANQSKPMLIFLFILLTFGFGFKAGLVPIHSWLPKAMVAPTPISAVLHAVAVVNVGVFGFIRTIYNIFGNKLYHEMGFDYVLAILASITILYAAIQGLRQKEIKKVLAMSTINQLSYMLIGLSCFTEIGKLGGLLHIYYHAFMKITLFYCAGAIMTQSHNKNVLKMGGIAKRMPITMACYTIAAVGIIGLPPVAGWVSKWYIMQGYFTSAHPIFGVVLVLSSILELGFFAPIIIRSYFQQEEPGVFSFKRDTSILGNEAPKAMFIPIIIVTSFSVLFGLWGFVPHWIAKPVLTQLLN